MKSNLNPQKEIVALHKEIFRRNQKKIHASQIGYTGEFQKYERRYKNATRSYEKIITLDELYHEIAQCNLVFVGDYHTLKQSQRNFMRILRKNTERKHIVIALEFVLSRHQNILDQYIAGQITDDSFLHQIEYEEHWKVGGFENFKPIFEFARKHHCKVIAVDSDFIPSENSLEIRDAHASILIADYLMKHPESVIFTLIGELHLHKTHLPLKVEQRLKNKQVSHFSSIVYQSCESIWWKLEEHNLSHSVEAVKISDGIYGLTNTPPYIYQQSFIDWLEGDDELLESEIPEMKFKSYADIICRFLDIDVGDALLEVSVHTINDLSFLERLKKSEKLSKAQIEFFKKQIIESESYYIPQIKTAYLGKLSINHTAEEAAHFVRHICCSVIPKGLVDGFYYQILEEALGFFGSKIINPKRKCTHLSQFEAILNAEKANPVEIQTLAVAYWVRLHHRLENGEAIKKFESVYTIDTELFNAVTHALGYILGDKMYLAMLQGLITKKEIRQLFYKNYSEEKSSLFQYFQLVQQLKSVNLPERA